MIAYFSMFNASFIEQKIYDVKITFSINKQFYSILNETSIEFYNKRGIDPYNKSNEAFTEVCYRSINFEYDLTQEYRREIVYSGYSITSISPDCSYLNYNLREKRLILFCEEINDDNYNIGYETILEPLSKRKVETLPIKCGKKFSGIEQNIAFFLFFSLCIVNIIATIFLCTIDLKQYLSKALDNDNIILLEEFGKKITNTEKGNEFKTEETIPETKNKNLSHIFVKNLFTLHPLFSLCSPSVLCPLYFNIGIFFNEIINILGWNSVFFPRKKLKKEYMIIKEIILFILLLKNLIEFLFQFLLLLFLQFY